MQSTRSKARWTLTSVLGKALTRVSKNRRHRTKIQYFCSFLLLHFFSPTLMFKGTESLQTTLVVIIVMASYAWPLPSRHMRTENLCFGYWEKRRLDSHATLQFSNQGPWAPGTHPQRQQMHTWSLTWSHMFIDPLEGVLLAYIIFTQALNLKLDGYSAVDSGFDFLSCRLVVRKSVIYLMIIEV